MSIVPIWARIAIVVLLAGLCFGAGWEVNGWRLGTDLQALKTEHAQTVADAYKAAVAQSEANTTETARRLKAQQENQRAQDAQLAAARADADRNARAADQLREQNASVARQWRDALAHSPAGSECASAGDAIGVLADVLGRADKRAGILAAYADSAHTAGLKCERDYDSLSPK